MEEFFLWLIYNIIPVGLVIGLLAALILVVAITLVAYGVTPRYSDDEIRRQLVAESRELSNWHVRDGVPCYAGESGEVIAFVGENQIHTTAVADYLQRREEYLRKRRERRE